MNTDFGLLSRSVMVREIRGKEVLLFCSSSVSSVPLCWVLISDAIEKPAIARRLLCGCSAPVKVD
jgi:hypothetical protein